MSRLASVKADWDGELQIILSDEFWGETLDAVSSSSSRTWLSLIQFKVLHRMHYSRAKLSTIYLDTDDRCVAR